MSPPPLRARTVELDLTWIALIALSAIGPALIGRNWGMLILVVAGLKFSLIGWSFMELRSAHRFWLLAPVAIGMVVLLVSGLMRSA